MSAHVTVVAAGQELDFLSAEEWLAMAGHPAPLLLSPGAEPRYLQPASGLPLGLGASSYPEHVEQIEPGSALVLITDGTYETRTASTLAALESLARLALALHATAPSMQSFTEQLAASLHEGGQVHDDIAILALQLDSSPAGTSRIET